jgi:hypothetical protein
VVEKKKMNLWSIRKKMKVASAYLFRKPNAMDGKNTRKVRYVALKSNIGEVATIAAVDAIHIT